MGDLDRALLLHVYHPHPNAVFLAVMAIVSFVGGGNALFVIVPFAVARRARKTVLRLLVAIAITAVVVYGVKHVVGRTRPYSCVDGVCPLGYGHPTDPSFPSGHSAGAFCFVGFFADRKRPWRTAGLSALALTIGVSRVVLGVHFPGDVAAGAIIGGTIGALTARAFAKRDEDADRKSSARSDTNG